MLRPFRKGDGLPECKRKSRSRPHAGSWRLFALAVVSVAVVLLWRATRPGDAARANPAVGEGRRRLVAEISFDVIEPPVVARREIVFRASPSNAGQTPATLECSGIAFWGDRLILTSDKHGNAVFTCAVDLDKMTIGQPRRHVLIRNEQNLLVDAESLTLKSEGKTAAVAYAMCSLSNDRRERPLPQRRHLARFALRSGRNVLPRQAKVLDVGAIREALQGHFKAIGVEPYQAYYDEFAGPEKNTYRWGNVEGIALVPQLDGLLCGMRNPLFKGRALLLHVSGVDEAIDAGDPSKLIVSDLFALDLGGRGVSDLCWDWQTRGYLIAAAGSSGPRLDRDKPYPPKSLDAALFWWSGRKSEKPVCFARMSDMTIEAICRIGDSRYIAVASDEGDWSEGRELRQSVVTIMDFMGVRYAR